MPTYDYECQNPNCNIVFDVEQNIKDPPLTLCSECKQATLKRLISGKGAFALSGTGWFKTGGY